MSFLCGINLIDILAISEINFHGKFPESQFRIPDFANIENILAVALRSLLGNLRKKK